MNKPQHLDLFDRVSNLIESSRNQIIKQVNLTMVYTYFEIGKMIVEEEQEGEERAQYGKGLLKALSDDLTKAFGKGFSVDNLQNMRNFYLCYSKYETLSSISNNSISETVSSISKNENVSKQQTLSAVFKLSWSHYLKLIRIDDVEERKFYEIETYKNNWSVRELQRQYDSDLYTRLALSRNKEEVKELSNKGLIIEKPQDVIKDPYILEFLGLPEKSIYSESELEQEIIDKLEHFLLELGTGFTFVARQKRISFDSKHFRIDLVFYNRVLKCFVLIDLKIGELKHQDIGQMQMYVNYYDREVKLEDENNTIGLILCRNKSESIVEYTLPKDNNQIFASKYKTVLPTKDQIKGIIGND